MEVLTCTYIFDNEKDLLHVKSSVSRQNISDFSSEEEKTGETSTNSENTQK